MPSNYGSITAWPQRMRPREKLLKLGAQALSDSELLAIFLRTGVKGYSAEELAHRLLMDFGSLHHLMSASQHELCQECGLGPAKYAQLNAILEMSKRFHQYKLVDAVSLTSSQIAADYLIERLRHLPYEVFMVIYLDSQQQVIDSEELFRGTINLANIYPREIVREVIKHNAASIIISHNHPSGLAQPSDADKRITQRIIDSLALIDVTVLDHFIIGQNDPYSFADHGLL